MGKERLKSLRRSVLAMRRMLREMESELEREIAEAAREKNGSRQEDDAAEITGRVIGRLNLLSGRSFSGENRNTVRLIRNLLEEGKKEEELILVTERKVAEWKNTDMQQYIRPETLYGEHFEGYLQEALCRNKEMFYHDNLARLAIERMQGGNQNV